jgi:hypothetical protein
MFGMASDCDNFRSSCQEEWVRPRRRHVRTGPEALYFLAQMTDVNFCPVICSPTLLFT